MQQNTRHLRRIHGDEKPARHVQFDVSTLKHESENHSIGTQSMNIMHIIIYTSNIQRIKMKRILNVTWNWFDTYSKISFSQLSIEFVNLFKVSTSFF